MTPTAPYDKAQIETIVTQQFKLQLRWLSERNDLKPKNPQFAMNQGFNLCFVTQEGFEPSTLRAEI